MSAGTLASAPERTAADLERLVVVLRGSFEANGVTRQRGEVLDKSGWPFGRVDSLIEGRYLGVAPYTLLETMKDCACGRRWQDQAARDTHSCPAEEKG